jgi:hypothetical protein
MMFFRIVSLGIAVVIFVGMINLGLASLLTISREELEIDPNDKQCVQPEIKSFWRIYNGFPNYNRDLVADYFGIYAAYASNVYSPGEKKLFQLNPQLFGWVRQGDPIEKRGGFYAEVFYRRTSERLSVMIVFRGTDGWTDIPDNVSNASYLTQMFNPWDQYRTARAVFKLVRANAHQAAGTLPVDYLAVGHSLGGGLARHMAAAFPCTAAITFNSSFVSNDFRLECPYRGQIVDIFEDQDFLSKIAVFSDANSFFSVSSRHQWYRFNNAEIGDLVGQHGIYQAAAAMARIPVVCLIEQKGCELKSTRYGDASTQEMLRGKDSVDKLYCRAAPAEVVDHRREYCE